MNSIGKSLFRWKFK